MKEDKIEVGEFVRCKNGKIAKIKDIENEFIYFDTEIYWRDGIPIFECETCFSDFIVKHSKDIIDLIEEGDYVNGKYVYSVGTAIGNLPIINHTDGTFTPSNLIKSIVTKEQMEAIQYVVQ